MAPSPTGNLHVGNARTALFNWLFARRQGGTFILRIEDTDQMRSTEESLGGVLESLRWLGMDWDEGPEVGGAQGPYFQMQRLDLYRAAARELVDGGHAYACYCTPEELETRRREALAAGRPPRYDRRCRFLTPEDRARFEAEGRAPAYRLAMPDEGETTFHDAVLGEVRFPNADLDDWIILRSNQVPTYNFAVVVDDGAMEISHVIRGTDHIANTPRQIHVYGGLGADLPVFAHVPNVHGMDGRKLSKRHGPTSVLDYRDMGYLPEAMRNFLALLGWSPGDDREILTVEEMVQAFSLERVNPSAARFNVDKLDWMNGEYLRSLAPEEVAGRLVLFMERARLSVAPEDLLPWVPLIQTRMRVLTDGPELIDFAFREIEPPATQALVPKKMSATDAHGALVAALRRLEGLESRHEGEDQHVADLDEIQWDRERTSEGLERKRAPARPERWREEDLEGALRALADELGMKAGSLFMILRAGTTGKTVSPPLFETMALLGRERCLDRLRRAERSLAQTLSETAT